MRVFGYVRVSSAEQEANGHGLDAQSAQIRSECERRGYEIIEIYSDTGSGKDMCRESLSEALCGLARGEAEGLVVAKLDRLTRSLIDFAVLLEWFERADVSLVALDFDLDTSTHTGELVAHIIAAVAQWERRAIGQRTSDAMAQMRARGLPLGPPAVADRPQLAARIRQMRDSGMSLSAICADLDAAGIPTLRGARQWRKSALQAVLGYQRRPPQRKTLDLPSV
jgi:DNA invertase Pin-like site-specific DNA recombinase